MVMYPMPQDNLRHGFNSPLSGRTRLLTARRSEGGRKGVKTVAAAKPLPELKPSAMVAFTYAIPTIQQRRDERSALMAFKAYAMSAEVTWVANDALAFTLPPAPFDLKGLYVEVSDLFIHSPQVEVLIDAHPPPDNVLVQIQNIRVSGRLPYMRGAFCTLHPNWLVQVQSFTYYTKHHPAVASWAATHFTPDVIERTKAQHPRALAGTPIDNLRAIIVLPIPQGTLLTRWYMDLQPVGGDHVHIYQMNSNTYERAHGPAMLVEERLVADMLPPLHLEIMIV